MSRATPERSWSRRVGTGLALASALAMAVTGAACRAPVEEGRLPAADPADYTVRGEITQLPEPEDVVSRVFIRHEAIEDFVNRQGEVVGMAAMTMPFPVAAGVSLEGLEVGDRVELTFRLDWEAVPPYEIVVLERLPPDTVLQLGEHRP